MEKLLLVDGHSILNRAFYGLPDLTNSAGQHTNAVLGFINILLKILEEEKPTHLAVAFDVHQKTFRHEMFAEYKGTRKGMPEELRQQVPVMKELLKAMQVTVLECPGFEADDIIGTMSRIGEKAGMEVTVLSGDRDLLQLATEHTLIRIPKTKGGKTTVENYHSQEVKELYGVTPLEFIDMKGLMGDASDNIPGVPGIGEKTAGKIIAQFHSIEEAHAHLSEIKPKKAMENLRDYYQQALDSRFLATIKLDVPLEVTMDGLLMDNLFTPDAYQMIKKLELKSLLKYFELPQEELSYSFETEFLSSVEALEDFFGGLAENSELGAAVFWGDEGLLGFGMSAESGKAVFFETAGEDGMTDAFLRLFRLHKGLTLVTHDLKSMLKAVPFEYEESDRLQDTSIAAYLINPLKESYGYDDLAKEYLTLTLPSGKELLEKKKLTSILLRDETVRRFLAYETCIPLMAWKKMTERMKELQLEDLYHDIELPTLFVLADMEEKGIRVDGEALRAYGEMLGEKEQELTSAVYEEAGQEFNINSPRQLGEVLFDKLGLPGAKKTKTGYSTNADVLNKLKKDHKIVEDVLEYRQVAKLKSTYADGLSAFIRSDGRIHGTFNQTITATGRISSTEPNLQNIPMRTELGRSIRKVFIPRDGYVFVDADYSQIELRVLAHFSGDERLIKAYQEDRDIHALTASQVFGVPEDQVDALMRRNAKAVNFGIVYGISAFGLSEDLGISKKEASDYIEGYFATYPGVKKFLDKMVEGAKTTGMTRTLFGRIRQVPELASSNFMQRSFGERIAMNAPIQGTAADIIKIAMIRVYERLKNSHLKSSLILQIHDELLIETHRDEVETVKQILTEEMMGAANLQVPLNIGISVGDTWYDAK